MQHYISQDHVKGTITPQAGEAGTAAEAAAAANSQIVGVEEGVDHYQIGAADRDMVLAAATTLDVPVSVRNKLYSALSRSLAKPWVPAAVLAKWSEDQENSAAKFRFLQSWCRNTRFQEVRVEQRHIQKSEDYKNVTFGWMSKLELDLKYQSSSNAEGAALVAKLIKGPCKPHPFFPKDRNMRLYKHVVEITEGRRQQNITEKGCTTKGFMEDNADALQALEAGLSKGALKDEDFDTLNQLPQPVDDKASKKKLAGKKEADTSKSAELDSKPDKARKAPAVLKLTACLNKLNSKEVEMTSLRTRLQVAKPNMMHLLDTHLEKLEVLKGKVEPLALGGEECDELSAETALFLQDKTMKNDVGMAAKQLKV